MSSTDSNPIGHLSKWALHIFWIVDCSASMAEDGKMEALNNAIREAIPEMQQEAADNPFAEMLIRAIKFSTGAQWHIAAPTKVADFKWDDLNAASGSEVTDLGKALSLVAKELTDEKMPRRRSLPPVLVRITDGQPSDEYSKGLKELMDQPWGSNTVRVGIGIGDDANMEVLKKFIGNPEIKPVLATNPGKLVKLIQWPSLIKWG